MRTSLLVMLMAGLSAFAAPLSAPNAVAVRAPTNDVDDTIVYPEFQNDDDAIVYPEFDRDSEIVYPDAYIDDK